MHKILSAGVCLAVAVVPFSPAAAADETAVGILAGLGLTAATGKTEMGDGAGSLEGTALTIAPAMALGARIGEHANKARVANAANEKRPLVLMAGDKKVDLSAYYQAEARIVRLNRALDKLGGCEAPVQLSTFDATKIKTGGVDVAAAVIGALKVDTSIKGFDVANPTMLLVNAVASGVAKKTDTADGTTVILTDELGSGKYDGPLATSFDTVSRRVEAYEGCVARLGKGASDDVKNAAAGLRAVLDAMTASKDATPSLIEAAIALEAVAKSQPLTLRVDAIKTGGNIIIRTNIFLQFGFPGAVTIRGGMVANWRLSDPESGMVIKSGAVACLTGERDMRSVGRRSKADDIWCTDENGQFTKAD